CSLEPLALERIAAVLPDHDVRIADLRYDGRLETALGEHRPRACGIACCFTTEHDVVLNIARTIKHFDRDIFVFVGGHHPSLCPERFSGNGVDAVVVGEGEMTASALVACLAEGGDLAKVPGLCVNTSEGQVRTPPSTLIADLDRLPLPRRDLTSRNRHRYFWGFRWPMALVETSRGCPYRCTFCSVWRFYCGKVRLMTPERVIEEIAAAPAEHIFFTDDNFLLSVPRARAIAELLRERGIRKSFAFQSRTDTVAQHPDVVELWKEVGLHSVFLGLEKTTEEGLSALHKKGSVEANDAALHVLNRLGVGYTGNLIVDPDWGEDDFARLRDYVGSRGLFSASFSILTPLPGTILYDNVRDRIVSDACELYDLFHAVLPTKLPLSRFYREFAGLWQTALSCRPRSKSWNRLIRMAKAVLTGRLPVGLLRQGLRAIREMCDASMYLAAHVRARDPRTSSAHRGRSA
ncbi:MAG: B12-binding domain-containing radical SAM protein, partial [Armatimonadota bacterium]